MRPTPSPIGRPNLIAVLFAAMAGCTGAPLATTIAGPSPLPAPDAFTCVRDQLKAVGFAQTSYDIERLRLSARRLDESQRRPDTQFRRTVDRLDIEVAPGSGDALSNITVDAATYAELTTQRGPTEDQEKTSETARNAAQTILQKCSQPVDSLSVPG